MAKKTTKPEAEIVEAEIVVPNTETTSDVEQVTENVAEAALASVENLAQTPAVKTEVLPLNWQKAFSKYTEEEQEEIVALSEKIDVTKPENVMQYGAGPLIDTFKQCGDFLKDEKGSDADQAVIERLRVLSQKAAENKEEFDLVLQPPNAFQKFLMKINPKKKKSHTDKIQKSAISNYKLLAELQDSYDDWLEMLQEAWSTSAAAILSDAQSGTLLEKYIIAGYLAQERIEKQITDSEAEYQETGLIVCKQQTDQLREGYKIFQTTMGNLEKSRAMYQLSIAQLALVKHSNENVQISINTQKHNTLTLLSQQLRNAVLDAKTREVLDGQKALTVLNDEVIKDISKSIGATAEQTEKLLYTGVYNVAAAKEAVSSVIVSCNNIQKTATQMLPKMKADVAQINSLIEELEPCVAAITQSQVIAEKAGKNNPSSSDTSVSGGKLDF